MLSLRIVFHATLVSSSLHMTAACYSRHTPTETSTCELGGDFRFSSAPTKKVGYCCTIFCKTANYFPITCTTHSVISSVCSNHQITRNHLHYLRVPVRMGRGAQNSPAMWCLVALANDRCFFVNLDPGPHRIISFSISFSATSSNLAGEPLFTDSYSWSCLALSPAFFGELSVVCRAGDRRWKPCRSTMIHKPFLHRIKIFSIKSV